MSEVHLHLVPPTIEGKGTVVNPGSEPVAETTSPRLCVVCNDRPGVGDGERVLCQPCAIELIRLAFTIAKPKITAVGTVQNPPT